MPGSRTIRYRLILPLLVLAVLLASVGQTAADQPPIREPGRRIELTEASAPARTFVRARELPARTAQSATFVVQYDAAFQADPVAQAAFQRAVDIWSTLVTSPVPIVIEARWSVLGTSTLGSAGATYTLADFSGAPRTDTAYSAALANRIAGRDLYPDYTDIQAEFNSTKDWYFGTDGNTPSTKSDFVSVVMHEIGHGLGLADSFVYNTTTLVGTYGGSSSRPTAYDTFAVNGSGQTLISLGSGTLTLGLQLVGNQVYWNGAGGIAGAGGTRPRLYAPTTYSSSLVAHLDEATYPAGDPNSLMTPQLSRGEAIHDPGPIGLGMLADIGWSTSSSSPTATSTPAQTSTPTATRTVTRTPTATSPTVTPVASASPVATATPIAVPASGSPSKLYLPAAPRALVNITR